MKRTLKLISLLSLIISILLTAASCNSEKRYLLKDFLEVDPKGRFDFAVNLMKHFPKDKNYMFSPLSIKIALAMTANGAKGQTQAEILKTAGIQDLQQYNKYASALIDALKRDKMVKFKVANSIWLNKDAFKQNNVRFKDTFKQNILGYYRGEAGEVNNNNAVNTINNWISRNTENKMNNVIEDSNFLAILANTLYFKGDWKSHFEKINTQKKQFTDKNGVKSQTDFMLQTASLNYYENEDIQAVSIPYKNPNVSMYIVLPKNKQYAYTSGGFDKIIENMKSEKVGLSIPKFKVEFGIQMKDILMEMGIKNAFLPDYGLKEMIGDCPENIFISQVIHRTYIDVNEGGTEAAAVTTEVLIGASQPNIEPKIYEFNADHPFVYFIRENQSGEVLFLGEFGYVK